jgi:hypothetical protein
VDSVPLEPLASFPERCVAAAAAASAAGRPYGLVYVSQISYLTQQTLLPDVPAFVEAMVAAAGQQQGPASRGGSGWQQPGLPRTVLVVDGYHGFGALPVDLSGVARSCCYVAGLLKHVGCGANCAFMTLPAAWGLQPPLTGWLADPSVLGPGSEGVRLGSPVGYTAPSLALQGGTPAFMLPLLAFVELVGAWEGRGRRRQRAEAAVAWDGAAAGAGALEEVAWGEEEEEAAGRAAAAPAGLDVAAAAAPAAVQPAIDVAAVHRHVVRLQRRLLAGLAAAQHPGICLERLVTRQRAGCRSHTLAFRQDSPEAARAVVESLLARGVLVDTRRGHVRVGLGFNHSEADVERLLAALG